MRRAIKPRDQILAFLLGMTRDIHRAEDLLQNTYVVICEKWEDYRPGTNFLAWAFQIARFKFLQSIDPSKRQTVTLEAEALEASIQTVEDPPEMLSQQREALRECLSQIEHRSKQAMEMHYQAGVSCKEIAKRLNMSLIAFYKLLSRVRIQLQECAQRRIELEERGV